MFIKCHYIGYILYYLSFHITRSPLQLSGMELINYILQLIILLNLLKGVRSSLGTSDNFILNLT